MDSAIGRVPAQDTVPNLIPRLLKFHFRNELPVPSLAFHEGAQVVNVPRRDYSPRSRHRNFGDDEKRDPGNDGAIDHADDCLAECFDITTRGKEAACCDEPNPDESEAAQRPQRDKGLDVAEQGDIH